MVMRILTVVVLALSFAVAAPAALAAEKPRGGKDGRAELKKLMEKAKTSCGKAREQQGKGKAHRAQCVKALRELIVALRRAEKRIEQARAALAQTIETRCSGEGSADRCAKARERLAKLESVAERVATLIARIEGAVSRGSGSGSGDSDDTQVAPEDVFVGDEVPSPKELAAELAAAGA